MEKLEQKRILQETALLHYKGWQEGMERHSREPLFQMLGECTLEGLLELLDDLLGKIPVEVDYDRLYTAAVLECVFPRLMEMAREADSLDTGCLMRLFEYAKIFLQVGDCDRCLACCDVCLQENNCGLLPPEIWIKIFFSASKASRDQGEYPAALEKLRQALEYIDGHPEIAYMTGAGLLRIGKVYSDYLMMIGVSICFLQEAEVQLQMWLDNEDEEIRRYIRGEYAICLDSMGQYWREKNELDKALRYFEDAQRSNEELGRQSGVFRNWAHRIAVLFKKEGTEGTSPEEQRERVRILEGIIRLLGNDPDNQRGVGVRRLQLARMKAVLGDAGGAEFSLRDSREVSRLYRDDKTLIKAKIAELQYHIYSGETDVHALLEVQDLARERRYYESEITLNDMVIDPDGRYGIHGVDVLSRLQRNRTLFLELSGIAQDTIRRIKDHRTHSEFSYLSERSGRDLLENVVGDYEWFIRKLDEIISQLLKITKERTDDLLSETISAAEASLASGVVHDLKHILTTGVETSSETCPETLLDMVINALNQWEHSIPREEWEQLIHRLRTVNGSIKENIYPRMIKANRAPFRSLEEIHVRGVLLDLSRQKTEEYQEIQETVEVECEDTVTLEYNFNLFSTLMKELLRNAIDYQRKNHLEVRRYILTAREKYKQVSFSVMTEFLDEGEARRAGDSIRRQLRPAEGSATQDGYGIKMLRSFMRFKTGGAAMAQELLDGKKAGISFVVPGRFCG